MAEYLNFVQHLLEILIRDPNFFRLGKIWTKESDKKKSPHSQNFLHQKNLPTWG